MKTGRFTAPENAKRVNVFAAISASRGKVLLRYSFEPFTAANMVVFLKDLREAIPKPAKLCLCVDGASIHRAQIVR